MLLPALEGIEEPLLRPVMAQRHVRGVLPLLLGHIEGGELDVRRVGQADGQCTSSGRRGGRAARGSRGAGSQCAESGQSQASGQKVTA